MNRMDSFFENNFIYRCFWYFCIFYTNTFSFRGFIDFLDFLYLFFKCQILNRISTPLPHLLTKGKLLLFHNIKKETFVLKS